MIGVATTAPVPSSATSACPSVFSATFSATSATAPTVWWTKMSRGRHCTPAARARATTCIDRMLSPPRSKNESSTPRSEERRVGKEGRLREPDCDKKQKDTTPHQNGSKVGRQLNAATKTNN